MAESARRNNAKRSAESIKEAVRDRYGARAKQQLARAELGIELIEAPDVGACCGPSGCGPTDSSAGDGEAPLEAILALYASDETEGLPASVTEVSLGCGNPTAIAELQPGETVLDLGSGGGIDCFVAAKKVGPAGRVIGVDMTDEMLKLAQKNASELGTTNVEFRKGEIEALPVEDGLVDVIISNCVINLSVDKDLALLEAFRVLKPGGRFRVSDIVLTRELSVGEEEYLASWSGCVAGALLRDDFASKLWMVGFESVRVSLDGEHQEGVHSALIEATKPCGAG